MKKLIFLLSILFLAVSVEKVAAGPAYFENPGQGMFQCHADNNINSDYTKGGGLIVRWDQLQPKNNDELDQTALNSLTNSLKSKKKRYLHFMIYGMTEERIYPSWLNLYDSDSTNDQIGVTRDSKGIFPQPWDSRYQEKLGRFLTLLGTALKNAGVTQNIEYLEPAAGGYWASTHLWIPENDLKTWAVAAGCQPTDWSCLGVKYTAGVNGVLEKYLSAFPDNAVMVIGGSCRYSTCSYAGFNSMVAKYGMRVMIKSAGLGQRDSSCGVKNYFQPLCGGDSPITKCGDEPWGSSVACHGAERGFDPALGCGYYQTLLHALSTEKISYYCLYNREIGCQAIEDGRKIDDVNREIAGKLGAQITLLSANLNGNEKNVGSDLTIDFRFGNNGSTTLIAPLKQGIKWVPSSYKLFLEFVKNGQVALYQEFAINPPTTSWVPANFNKEVSFSVSLNVSEYLGGANQNSRIEYKLYTGLTDPSGEKNRFAFKNSGQNNDLANRRYLISDSFTVLGQGVPTSTPGAPTNTPRPTDGSPTQTSVPPSTCPADKPSRSLGNANCDSSVDNDDFTIWKSEFLKKTDTVKADFNGNNIVNGVDFMIWWKNRQ